MNESIENMIYLVRGQRVMLDQDLALLYGSETGAFNRAFKRNIEKFPEDFAFQLTKYEWESLRCQFGISKVSSDMALRSQIATSNVGRGGRRYLPYVFTEHGVVMLANVLRSKHAVKMSIEVVRAFIQMRKMLASSEKFDKELRELKSFVLRHSQKSDQEFRRVWQAIEKLGQPTNQIERRIGFELG